MWMMANAARWRPLERVTEWVISVATPVRRHVIVAVPPWLVAHAIVFATMAVAAVVHGGLPQTGDVPAASGLFAWDSAWYREIADRGYGPLGEPSVRFFPLLPLLVRVLSAVLLIPSSAVLIAVCWLAALAYGAAMHALVLRETGDPVAARRASWLIQLVPGANVLVLGYTEALGGLLAIGFFLALRSGRPGWLAVLGALAGLVRPTGLLLAVPALIIVGAGRLNLTPARLAAALSPVIGTVAYLGWCWFAYGDALLPFSVQTMPGLRGAVANNPIEALLSESRLGLPWPASLALIVVAGLLLWVCLRRLPFAYAAWAGLMVGAAITADQLHSLPRYLAAVFPLVIAAVLVWRTRTAWSTTVIISTTAFAGVAYLCFTPGYVP